MLTYHHNDSLNAEKTCDNLLQYHWSLIIRNRDMTDNKLKYNHGNVAECWPISPAEVEIHW